MDSKAFERIPVSIPADRVADLLVLLEASEERARKEGAETESSAIWADRAGQALAYLLAAGMVRSLLREVAS